MATRYCTVEEVKRFTSENFAVDAADHDDDGTADTDVIEDQIDWASEEIQSCLSNYAIADMTSSVLVNRWAVLLTSVAVAQLRGNSVPVRWEDEYDRLMSDDGTIEKVNDGRRRLPGIAVANQSRPRFSNLTVDRRFRRSKVRVTRSNSSTNPTVSPIDRDFADLGLASTLEF